MLIKFVLAISGEGGEISYNNPNGDRPTIKDVRPLVAQYLTVKQKSRFVPASLCVFIGPDDDILQDDVKIEGDISLPVVVKTLNLDVQKELDTLARTLLFQNKKVDSILVQKFEEIVYHMDGDIIKDSKIKRFRNTPETSMTLLHMAARFGHLGIAKILLLGPETKFTAVNERDDSGGTALHIAAAGGHVEVCKLLLLNPEAKFTAVNEKYTYRGGNTALHSAAEGGHVEVCKLLIVFSTSNSGLLKTDCDVFLLFLFFFFCW